MQFPELNLETFTINDNIDFGILVNKKTGKEYRIETLDTLFLRCIDGKKSVSEIHDEISALLDYEISYEAIWKAFDNLSDIGILKHRLAPPAGGQTTSRRSFIRKFSATAAATGAVITASPSFGQTTEQTAKQAEQSAKTQAEKDLKGATSEQNSKNAAESGQKEQNSKMNAEEAQKEQNTKNSAESNQKEQSSKMNAEQAQKEHSQKLSHEQSSKEAAVKGGGGGTPPASVPEPDTLTLFGLGLASLAILRKRASKVVDEEDSEDEA